MSGYAPLSERFKYLKTWEKVVDALGLEPRTRCGLLSVWVFVCL